MIPFLGLAFAGPVAAAPAVAAESAEASLSGEACALAPAPADELPTVIRIEAALQCGGHPVGRSGSIALPAGTVGQAALDLAAEMMHQALAPAASYDCEALKPLPGEPGVVVLPCRRRADGWASLMLARPRNGRMGAILGPASAWPALRAAVGLAPSPLRGAEQAAALAALWSRPVVIASAGDQAQIQALRDAARLANGRFAFAEAERALRQALELQLRLFGDKDVIAAAILMDLAVIVANEGRHDEADRLLQRAGPIIELSPRAADRARLAGYQANVAWIMGDTARALNAARAATAQWRAIVAATPTGEAAANPLDDPLAPGELAMALNREAGFFQQEGDVASANARASEALTLLDKATDAPRWWRADVLANLALSSIALGRLSASEAYFKAAIALRRQAFGEDPATLRMRVALGRAYQGEGLASSAIVAYREALAIARTLPRDSVPFTPDDLAPFAMAVLDYAATVQDPKARQGLFAEVFDAFQLTAAPSRDRVAVLASQTMVQASPGLAELLRQIADGESALAQLREGLAKAQALPADERIPGQIDALQQQLGAGEALLAAARGKLAAGYPEYRALLAPSLPKVDAVRSALGNDEALVTFLIGRKASFVQLVRRSGLSLGRVDLGQDELRDAVRSLRHGLEIEGKAVADFDTAASHALYSRLLGPVAGDLAGIGRLVVIPSGPLASLPFEVLVTKPGRAGDYAGSRWLVQDMAIAHSPSLASFMALRSTRLVRNQPHRLLAVGDPVLGEAGSGQAGLGRTSIATQITQSLGACRRDGPVAAEVLRALPPLPDTRAEIAAVARALGGGSTVLVGREATEAGLRSQALGDYRILYFATHGILPGELRCQAEPALALTPPASPATTRQTDGMLDASEISALELHADLVVLSACNTAGSDGPAPMGGETLSGLALAFFHAGARNLVVSHWQVPSAATARLMTRLFAAMSARPDTAIDEALRQAQLLAITDRASAHPFFWGAFVVLGDGIAAPLQERGAL